MERLDENPDLARAWASHLAKGVQTARMISEIRTLRTVSERLDAWLGEHGRLPERGRWQEVAGELEVSREALYREFARRREL